MLARSCALTAVSAFLATLAAPQIAPAVRQQVREFCYEAHRQARATNVVRSPWSPALCRCWLGSWTQWEGTQLALALDATTLGDPLYGAWRISVVYRGCAIPVAWTVLAATAQHAWRREWWRMLRQGRPAVPHGPGPSSSWRIGACMPAGCFGVSPAWAGPPFCASTREAPSVPDGPGTRGPP